MHPFSLPFSLSNSDFTLSFSSSFALLDFQKVEYMMKKATDFQMTDRSWNSSVSSRNPAESFSIFETASIKNPQNYRTSFLFQVLKLEGNQNYVLPQIMLYFGNKSILFKLDPPLQLSYDSLEWARASLISEKQPLTLITSRTQTLQFKFQNRTDQNLQDIECQCKVEVPSIQAVSSKLIRDIKLQRKKELILIRQFTLNHPSLLQLPYEVANKQSFYLVAQGSLSLKSLKTPLPILTHSFPVIIRVPFKITSKVLFGDQEVELRLKVQNNLPSATQEVQVDISLQDELQVSQVKKVKSSGHFKFIFQKDQYSARQEIEFRCIYQNKHLYEYVHKVSSASPEIEVIFNKEVLNSEEFLVHQPIQLQFRVRLCTSLMELQNKLFVKFEPDGTNYMLLGKTRAVLQSEKEFNLVMIPLSVGKLKLPFVKFMEYDSISRFQREIEGLDVKFVNFGLDQYFITQS